MPFPKMTTRRWMLTVVAAAILNTCSIQVVKWQRINHYRIAFRQHEKYVSIYEEGRVTALKYVEFSQHLLETQLALAQTPRDRDAFVLAHIERSKIVLEREEKDQFGYHGVSLDLIELTAYMEKIQSKYNLVDRLDSNGMTSEDVERLLNRLP